MIKAIFFDAAGTLIHLREPVGYGYAKVAASFGITLDPEFTTSAFRKAWESLPSPVYKNGPASDGDRSWWRTLVEAVLDHCLGEKNPPAEVRAGLFESLYAHYATPETWQLYPDVGETLQKLQRENPDIRRLVLSNFDPRLRGILAGHGIAHHFQDFVISSEVGAYKPDPAIFTLACNFVGLPPSACLHVGDDETADVAGARAAGLQALRIDRPTTSLDSIFKHPNFPT